MVHLGPTAPPSPQVGQLWVDPTGPPGDRFVEFSNFGAATNLTAGAFTTLPIGTQSAASDPAPFTRNANGSLTCVIAGRYFIIVAASATVTFAATDRFDVSILIDGGRAAWNQGIGGAFPGWTVPYRRMLTVGQVISVQAFTDGAGRAAQVTRCTVER